MSVIHVRHIKKALNALYDGKIDLNDVQERSQTDIENHFLSRALAAYAIYFLAEASIEDSANSVVDTFDDNGIDAIKYDPTTSSLWLIQSKWIHSGNGCPEAGDVQKYVAGIKDLINAKWDRFNNKVRAKESEIEAALDDFNLRIKLVLVYTGGNLSEHQERPIADLLSELNDTSEIAEFIGYSLQNIHKAVVTLSQGESINFEIPLYQWGHVESPKQLYFGYANCSDLAGIWADFGQRLFHKNIRKFLGNTAVNASISETIIREPNNFLSFNNGVTIIAKSIKKKTGTGRDVGIFLLEGAHVVNGAQTVGMLGKNIEAIEQLDNAKVFIKIVSLEGVTDNFELELTKATNTQNRIEKKDFVSLDPKQERYRSELFLEEITYSFKSGDEAKSDTAKTHLREATIALACKSGDLQYAIWSKKQIGLLWDNIETPPYSDLFNEELTGGKIWKSIRIMRVIEADLNPFQARTEPQPRRSIAINGSNVIAHMVFSILPREEVENTGAAIIEEHINEKTILVLNTIVEVIAEHYPDAMVGRLFYNYTKTNDIISKSIEIISR